MPHGQANVIFEAAFSSFELSKCPCKLCSMIAVDFNRLHGFAEETVQGNFQLHYWRPSAFLSSTFGGSKPSSVTA
jgi:hypothetical protein